MRLLSLQLNFPTCPHSHITLLIFFRATTVGTNLSLFTWPLLHVSTLYGFPSLLDGAPWRRDFDLWFTQCSSRIDQALHVNSLSIDPGQASLQPRTHLCPLGNHSLLTEKLLVHQFWDTSFPFFSTLSALPSHRMQGRAVTSRTLALLSF